VIPLVRARQINRNSKIAKALNQRTSNLSNLFDSDSEIPSDIEQVELEDDVVSNLTDYDGDYVANNDAGSDGRDSSQPGSAVDTDDDAAMDGGGTGSSDFEVSDHDSNYSDHGNTSLDSDDSDNRPLIQYVGRGGGQAHGRGRGHPRGRGRGRGCGARVRDPSPPPRDWTDNLVDNVPNFGLSDSLVQPLGPCSADYSNLSILETFQRLFTDQFLDEIVRLTNKNYDTKKRLHPDKNKSNMDPLTRDELKAWLGLIFAMALYGTDTAQGPN
jgi:hypothetical protein